MLQKNITFDSASSELLFLRYYEQLRSPCQAILCLDGDLPSAHFFQCLNLPIFAVDGAANTLKKYDIKPAAIIGDLDSIQKENFADTPLVELADQNASDFEKALQHLTRNNIEKPLILGVNGGYLDHIFYNLHLLQINPLPFYAPPLFGFFLSAQEEQSLTLPLESKISIFGFPSTQISTKGLRWNLNNCQLGFLEKQQSTFNRSQMETIHFSVKKGRALILIYLHPIQDRGCL